MAQPLIGCLNLIIEVQSEKELDPLIVICSCSQHVVHGTFQNGVTDTTWKTDKILKSMFYLFSESPARRDVYIPTKGNIIFFLKTSDLFF